MNNYNILQAIYKCSLNWIVDFSQLHLQILTATCICIHYPMTDLQNVFHKLRNFCLVIVAWSKRMSAFDVDTKSLNVYLSSKITRNAAFQS